MLVPAQFPVNVTTTPGAQQVLATIDAAYQAHIKSVVPGVSQYEKQDWTLIPCCHGAFNSTQEQEFIREHEWSLALWELFGCVCL